MAKMGEAERIWQALVALGRRRRTERVPWPIRRRVIGYAQQGRREGRSWSALARGVGLAVNTVERWWVRLAESLPEAARFSTLLQFTERPAEM